MPPKCNLHILYTTLVEEGEEVVVGITGYYMKAAKTPTYSVMC